MHHREARIFRVLAKMVGDDVFTFKRDTTLMADVMADNLDLILGFQTVV